MSYTENYPMKSIRQIGFILRFFLNMQNEKYLAIKPIWQTVCGLISFVRFLALVPIAPRLLLFKFLRPACFHLSGSK